MRKNRKFTRSAIKQIQKLKIKRIAIDEDSGVARGEPEPVVTPAPFLAHPTMSADGVLV